MKFSDIPVGQTFHFGDDIIGRDYIKTSENMAERDGIRVKVTPDCYCQQWFTVFDPSLNVYVESIYFDGEINMTSDRMMARIFRGDAWQQFWQRRGCTLEIVTGTGEVAQ